MKQLVQSLVFGMCLVAVTILFPGSGTASVEKDGGNRLSPADPPSRYGSRQNRSFSFDHDILVPGSRDQDYTYGLNLNFAGDGVEDQWGSLHSPLLTGWIGASACLP